jgi:hypothetical protein
VLRDKGQGIETWPEVLPELPRKDGKYVIEFTVGQSFGEPQAFPFESRPRFLIFDRDAKYGLEVPAAVRSLKMSPARTSFQSPWQNGVAERWVESCRRDLLDDMIAINEQHLKRRLSDYVRYFHEDRTHLGLGKGTPVGRKRSTDSGTLVCDERLGGLHHR